MIDDETGAEGRYIPYSGGSLGWFENSGVPKVERGNNYKFFTAIDTVKVRQKLFERWGDDVNRRMEGRTVVEKETSVTLVWDGGKARAVTKDLSAHGLQLQLLEDPGLAKGDKISVHVQESTGEADVIVLASEIMWIARVGKRRLVWNLGIGFVDISPDDEIKLTEYLLG